MLINSRLILHFLLQSSKSKLDPLQLQIFCSKIKYLAYFFKNAQCTVCQAVNPFPTGPIQYRAKRLDHHTGPIHYRGTFFSANCLKRKSNHVPGPYREIDVGMARIVLFFPRRERVNFTYNFLGNARVLIYKYVNLLHVYIVTVVKMNK